MKNKLIQSLELEVMLNWANRNIEAHDLNQFASNDLECIEGKAYYEGQADLLNHIIEAINTLSEPDLLNADDSLDGYKYNGPCSTCLIRGVRLCFH